MIKAVIFDMDGVLIESEPYFIQAEIKILSKLGIKLTEEVAAEYLGLKLHDYIAALEQRFNTKLDHEQIAKELLDAINYLYEYEIPLVPQAAEMLDSLSQSYPLALATSREKHLAQSILNRHGVASYFPHGVYHDDVKKGKPDPEVFLKAARLLDIDPTLCAVVEDAENGFEAAKKARMYVIARKAQHNKKQNFSLADAVIKNLSEIPNILP